MGAPPRSAHTVQDQDVAGRHDTLSAGWYRLLGVLTGYSIAQPEAEGYWEL